MATLERFEDLESWKKGRELRKLVYAYTKRRAFAADHALVSQIRRAAQSVTSNIAEGFDRGGNKEFIQFLSQAKGSTSEVKDQLYTALDEAYVTQDEFTQAYGLAESVTKLIGGLMSYLQRTELSGSKFKRFAGSKPQTLNPKP